jgi:hypothetical protein
VDLSALPGGGTAEVDTIAGDFARAPYNQDKNREAARIFEDLSAGVDIRTDAVDANLRAGSALWMEGSPFTVWKRDPRPKLAWYYESYEPELSSYQYYTQKFFYRRNDMGRLSWPKKPFGGIEVDAFRMPGDIGLQFDFAQPSNMLPTKTDGNTYNAPGDAEALGSINSLGQLYFGRLTKKKIYKDVMLGGNLLWVELPTDIINQTVYSSTSTTTQGFRYQFREGNPYFTKPRVFSLDARGNLNAKYSVQADFALAYQDSVRYFLPDSLVGDTSKAYPGAVYNGSYPNRLTKSDLSPAGYVKLNSAGTLPMETELFYAGNRQLQLSAEPDGPELEGVPEGLVGIPLLHRGPARAGREGQERPALPAQPQWPRRLEHVLFLGPHRTGTHARRRRPLLQSEIRRPPGRRPARQERTVPAGPIRRPARGRPGALGGVRGL